MGLFRRRKSDTEKVISNRDTIETNVKAMNVLIELAEKNNEVIERIKVIQDKIKYLNPSTNPKVIDYDKKIFNQIGDIKIAFASVAKKGNYDEVDRELSKLNILVAERAAE